MEHGGGDVCTSCLRWESCPFPRSLLKLLFTILFLLLSMTFVYIIAPFGRTSGNCPACQGRTTNDCQITKMTRPTAIRVAYSRVAAGVRCYFLVCTRHHIPIRCGECLEQEIPTAISKSIACWRTDTTQVVDVAMCSVRDTVLALASNSTIGVRYTVREEGSSNNFVVLVERQRLHGEGRCHAHAACLRFHCIRHDRQRSAVSGR